MTDLSSQQDVQQRSTNGDVSELNKDLERMIDEAEKMSVKLTWMAYEMAALRTSPELADCMLEVEEAYLKFRRVFHGDSDEKTEMDKCSETAATTQT